MGAIWAAIAVAMIGGPLLTLIQGRQRTKDMRQEADLRAEERREDWRRQDLVAERLQQSTEKAASEARTVAMQTQTAAQLLLQNNRRVAAATKEANTKLDVIHTLVNSNMTAAKQGELDMGRALLASLRETIALRSSLGQTPSEEAAAELLSLEDKVARMAADLRDRIEQTKVADAQIFIAEKSTRGDDADDGEDEAVG